MGIKGIYREIGPGSRKSLCKLAVEQLERTGRPLRLAIDISIWQFQVQAARGGSSPALRTLFYRLVRLLGHSIQPIFVFDGPNKPAFKRNKRSAGSGDPGAKAMAKRLIRLFGFTVHDAPGEAEAECALLQQQDIVDAVLSEDVDTVMFGCTRTLRNWSSETRGNKTPTHVSVYDTAELQNGGSGLDREGMVLVALMSGGDYIPEGIPGCGVKVACEAAKAGFGHSLCRIKMADKQALTDWKENLLHELRTNESGYFRTRHKALVIPERFPNMEVLRYYTHPVVSQQATLDKLREDFPAKTSVDVVGLRNFVRDTFDWTYKIGAIKFIRVLAPSLLLQTLVNRGEKNAPAESQDLDAPKKDESALVKAVSSRRTHFSTDATPELRVSFIPVSILPLDLDAEPEEVAVPHGREGLALNSDDEFEEEVPETGLEEGAPRGTSRKKYDPSQPELVWVPEAFAKLGIPLTVGEWEEQQRAKELRIAAKSLKKTRPKKKDMPTGAIDQWVRISKPRHVISEKGSQHPFPVPSSPSLPQLSPHRHDAMVRASSPPFGRTSKAPSLSSTTTRSKKPQQSTKAPAPQKARTNPWTLAGSQSSARVTKATATATTTDSRQGKSLFQPIVISSSPHRSPPLSPDGADLRLSKRPQSPSPTRQTGFVAEEVFSSPSKARRKDLTSSPGTSPSKVGRKMPATRGRRRDATGFGESSTQASIKDYGFVAKPRGIIDGADGKTTATTTATKISDQTSAPVQMPGIEADEAGAPPSPRAPTRTADWDSPSHWTSAGGDFVIIDDDDDGDNDLFGAQTDQRQYNPPKPPETRPAAAEAVIEAEEEVIDKDDNGDDGNGNGNGQGQGKSKSQMTKLYILTRGGSGSAGYFDEVEVTREEADRFRRELEDRDRGEGSGLGMGTRRPRQRRVLRYSEVSVVDLTGLEG